MGKQIANWRKSKKNRIAIILFLLLVIAILACFFEKIRWLLLFPALLLGGALGLEVAEQDIDLGTLIETRSFAESKVKRTANGDLMIGETCSQNEFNCTDFTHQAEAQEVFDKCNWTDGDIHGLDRDGDGKACESLRKTAP